jgi:hypothetical protein
VSVLKYDVVVAGVVRSRGRGSIDVRTTPDNSLPVEDG